VDKQIHVRDGCNERFICQNTNKYDVAVSDYKNAMEILPGHMHTGKKK
jgi:hypothetical protein